MKKIATEKSGSVRNQAIYFQLYESFISEMNVLPCSCIKMIKATKKIVSFLVTFFLLQDKWLRTLQKTKQKTGSVRNLKMHTSFSSEILQPSWL